ncbi:STAS domain-containing protein [Quadrisphaera sp. KR29]|uniref:STAS domain-containing protein n=1 Tax=Quadrisphaera sp. KR29 TaxID=3461391 RepID=UPI004044B2ED
MSDLPHRVPAPPTDLSGPRGRPGPAAAEVLDHGAPGDGPLLRWTSDGVVIALHGEVDCATCPQLSAVRELLAHWGEPAVVDASSVTFIDLVGLRAVLSLAGDAPVLVLSPSSAVVRLLHLLEVAGLVVTAPAAGPAGGPGRSRLRAPAGPSLRVGRLEASDRALQPDEGDPVAVLVQDPDRRPSGGGLRPVAFRSSDRPVAPEVDRAGP